MSGGRVIARCYVVREPVFGGETGWFESELPPGCLWAFEASQAAEMPLPEARRVQKLYGGKVYRRGKRAKEKS